MKQTWRWFGPDDTVRIDDLLQIGVQGVVSALHHVQPGVVWTPEEIARRQTLIATRGNGEPSHLAWDVIESLPVSEAIKTQSSDCADHFGNYRQSLRHIADAGIATVCYNFMPILDWTRTNLREPMPHGGTAMRFDLVDFAVFDLHILRRPAASDDYSDHITDEAQRRFDAMSDAQRTTLQQNIVAGLPGANDNWSIDDVRQQLNAYSAIDADRLRANLVDFLSEVTPLAQSLGLRLCCHPDDPPFALLGLPRVMSCEVDYAHVMQAVDIPANGITYCTGSLGVAEDFDATGFIARLGSRIHFAHLRNTSRTDPRDAARSSFYEAAHLEGDTDMVAVVRALVTEERRRRDAGREDWQIPMRPDHGQDLLDDLTRDSMPGYPMLGRMRGLAELRGAMAALS